MTDPTRSIDWRTDALTASAYSRASLPLAESTAWMMTADGLTRFDHRFFSIIGIRVTSRSEANTHLMMREAEPGLHVVAVRPGATEPEWLVQCRIEPGAPRGAQLVPTVQTSHANAQRAHEGTSPPLVETMVRQPRLLAGGVWSESGAWFFGKRTESRSVLVDDTVEPLDDSFRWVPASQMRELMTEPDTLSAGLRSTLATGPWDLLASTPTGPFSGELHASYHAPDRGVGLARDHLARARRHRPNSEPIPLAEVADIVLAPETATPIRHPSAEVHHVLLEAKGREVPRFDQPLLAPRSSWRSTLLLVPGADGILRARCALDHSPGLVAGPEWSTTTNGPFSRSDASPATDTVLAEVWTSLDAARFDHAQHHIVVARAHSEPPTHPGQVHIDLTLGALERLVHTPGAVTSELRSAVAVLLSLA